ncbi:MAG: hypothetical protein KDA84_24970 [Planctomycetaceae bacterium]|nr:hypothetical protein [Planctomycetaceae bacterium]
MGNRVEDYDDEFELTEYIWHNYPQLLTPLESLAHKAFFAEQKAQAYGGTWQKSFANTGGAKTILV